MSTIERPAVQRDRGAFAISKRREIASTVSAAIEPPSHLVGHCARRLGVDVQPKHLSTRERRAIEPAQRSADEGVADRRPFRHAHAVAVEFELIDRLRSHGFVRPS